MAAESPKPLEDALTELERDMLRCQEKLDRLGLHQAAAHLDMAINRIRQAPPSSTSH